MSKYTLRLSNEFRSITSAAARTIAGIVVPAAEALTVDVKKKAQLDALLADKYVEVTDPTTGERVTTDEPEAPVESETVEVPVTNPQPAEAPAEAETTENTPEAPADAPEA